MKVFVSGGAGVIGRELVKRLHRQGATITVGDLEPYPQDFPKGIEYAKGDLCGLGGMIPAYDVFFHLAATFERLGESYDHWEQNFHHNVRLSHHLLDVIEARRVVFASSYLIEPHPRNLTGAAKLFTECELEFLRKHRGQDSVSARIYRSYGCGSRDVISRWIRSGLRGESITVHNEQTSLDFIYAGDVAEALLRLGKADCQGVIPIGFGAPISIKDVVFLLKRQIKDLDVKYTDDQSPVESSACDTRLMERMLGWLPQTSVADGIAKVIHYERKRCG